jgi:AcrR family transcriptional regulator
MTVARKNKLALILTHAIEVFAAEGFRHADVQVIADRAGVGKGTVYRHFGNKEELFWAATYWVLERLGRHLMRAIEGGERPLEALRAAGIAYAEFFERAPAYLEIFVQNRAEFRGSIPPSHKEFHERMITVFAEVVQRGIDRGEIRRVDPRATIASLGGVFYGTVMFGCYVADDFELTEFARNTVDHFLRGIQAEQVHEG